MVVTIRNVSDSACTLEGDVSNVSVTTGDATVSFPTAVDKGGSSSGAVLVEPGGSVEVAFVEAESCDGALLQGPTKARSLEFSVDGAVLSVGGVYLPTPPTDCPAQVSAPHPVNSAVSPTSYPGLVASYNGPSSAASGASFDYAITLSNRSDSTMSFESCPAYTETIGPAPVYSERYALNCNAVPSRLGPGDEATYAMQVSIPKDAAGTVKLGWVLDQGPGAGAAIDVS
jgi:hypothetical protein